jgi:hypothetical protein
MFHFTCFNVEDPDDPAVGLVNGELAIPGNLLRREVFDPVINEVSVPISSIISCRERAQAQNGTKVVSMLANLPPTLPRL